MGEFAKSVIVFLFSCFMTTVILFISAVLNKVLWNGVGQGLIFVMIWIYCEGIVRKWLD